jgi:hypothetical protein
MLRLVVTRCTKAVRLADEVLQLQYVVPNLLVTRCSKAVRLASIFRRSARQLHTSAYVSIRQHTSAYVSIRQHTSAYVSIRQHPSSEEARANCAFRLVAMCTFVLVKQVR